MISARAAIGQDHRVTGVISSVVVGVILLQLYPANTALALRITPVRLRNSH